LELKGMTQIKALSLADTLNQAAETDCHSSRIQGWSPQQGEAFASEIQRRAEDLVLQEDEGQPPATSSKEGTSQGSQTLC
jgi:hypothetical protein